MRAAGWGLACVVGWLTAVGVGVAGYAAEAGRNPIGAIPFALPYALAVAAVVMVAWLVTGERRAAFLFGASLLGFCLGVATLVFVIFWGFGEEVRVRLGIPRPQYYPWRSEILLRLAKTTWDSSIAILPGSVVGAIVGILLSLSRSRPKVAGALAVGLLLTVGVSAPWLVGAATRCLLAWRSEGSSWNATSMSEDELARMLGTLSGSVVGATLAGPAARIMRRPDRHPSALST